MITEKKILVFGSGISGIGAVKLLEQAGVVPTLYDGNAALKEADIRARLPKDSRVNIVLGEMPKALKEETELVILSPGIPVDLPLVQDMRTHGAVIWGEVELAYHFGLSVFFDDFCQILNADCHKCFFESFF